MQAKDIMVQPVIVVREETTLADVARLLLEHRINGVPVVDAEGKLSGILTVSDFTGKPGSAARHGYYAPRLFGEWLTHHDIVPIYRRARNMTAREVMTTRVVTTSEDEPLAEVIHRALRHGVHRLPVVRDGIPVGMVTRHDLLKLMLHQGEDPAPSLGHGDI